MKLDKDTIKAWTLFIAFALLVLGILLGIGWYQAWVQAELYRREGIDITTWEVFCGARPAERKLVE